MNYEIDGFGAQVKPDEKYQYRNKGDVPFNMNCEFPKSSNRITFDF